MIHIYGLTIVLSYNKGKLLLDVEDISVNWYHLLHTGEYAYIFRFRLIFRLRMWYSIDTHVALSVSFMYIQSVCVFGTWMTHGHYYFKYLCPSLSETSKWHIYSLFCYDIFLSYLPCFFIIFIGNIIFLLFFTLFFSWGLRMNICSNFNQHLPCSCFCMYRYVLLSLQKVVLLLPNMVSVEQHMHLKV